MRLRLKSAVKAWLKLKVFQHVVKRTNTFLKRCVRLQLNIRLAGTAVNGFAIFDVFEFHFRFIATLRTGDFDRFIHEVRHVFHLLSFNSTLTRRLFDYSRRKWEIGAAPTTNNLMKLAAALT